VGSQQRNNGDTLHLSITVKSSDPAFGGEPFYVMAYSPDGKETHWYFGFVGN
jgi:hypothetical protein